jgi:hypothetical protein
MLETTDNSSRNNPAAVAREVNFALRSYERCAARSSRRSAQNWADIASMLWSSLQGPAALAMLPIGSDRRRFVMDRYRDADTRRAMARLLEERAAEGSAP